MKCRQSSFEVSIQSGSSIHSPTPCPVRKGSSTSTARASELDARLAASITAPIVAGPVALNGPASRSSAAVTIHAARSRTSTSWIGRHAGPGTRTSPPRATRWGQYVNRPVGSCGPTMSPARTAVARPANASSTARSQSALSAP